MVLRLGAQGLPILLPVGAVDSGDQGTGYPGFSDQLDDVLWGGVRRVA
jgi:hypothetical protein